MHITNRQRHEENHLGRLVRPFLAALLIGATMPGHGGDALAQTREPGKPNEKITKEERSAAAAAKRALHTPARGTVESSRTDAFTITDVGGGKLPLELEDSLQGSGIHEARKVRFSGGAEVALVEDSGSSLDFASMHLPVVDSPLGLTGPLTVTWPDGTEIVSTMPYTPNAVANWLWPDESSNSSIHLVWLDSGKYWMITGPWLGTATEVGYAESGAPIENVGFSKINAERLMVPLAEFPTPGTQATWFITTPYGVMSATLAAFTEYHPALVNGVAPGDFGSWDVLNFDADLSVYDAEGDGSFPTLAAYRTRDDDVVPNGQFIYYDTMFVATTDFGGGSINLASYITDDHAKFLAPNVIYRSGAFTSTDTGRVISFTVQGEVRAGESQYIRTLTFTDTQGLGLGKLSFMPRLDEDVWDYSNDMVAMVGTPGQKDFIIMNPDESLRVGFGLRGLYTPTAGYMENASWDGFATGEYAAFGTALGENGVTYSSTAVVGTSYSDSNINTTDLTEKSEPEFYTDKVYIGDSSVSMKWTADPNATTAKMTMILQQIAADPTSGGTDARAANIVVKNGATMVPLTSGAFVSETTNYSATSALSASSVQVTVTLVTTDAIVANVRVLQPGVGIVECSTAPYDCPLALGVNVIEVVVRSGNGIETKTYRFEILRAVLRHLYYPHVRQEASRPIPQ